MAKELGAIQRISVDLFLFNHKNFNLPTIAPLICCTGGHLEYFASYNPYVYLFF